jgi:hypothetical protein
MNEQSWRKFVQSCHPGQYLIRVFSELAKVSAAFFLTEFQLWRNSNCFLRRETKTHLHILTRGANFVLMLVCSKRNVLYVIITTQPLVWNPLFLQGFVKTWRRGQRVIEKNPYSESASTKAICKVFGLHVSNLHNTPYF